MLAFLALLVLPTAVQSTHSGVSEFDGVPVSALLAPDGSISVVPRQHPPMRGLSLSLSRARAPRSLLLWVLITVLLLACSRQCGRLW